MADSKRTKKTGQRRPPKTFEQCLDFAVRNIVRYGDTDIFPYPFERQVMRDKQSEVLSILMGVRANFEKSVLEMPIERERLLSAVGYTGFRQGTQIDPLWNVYLLGLVICVGHDIERVRISRERRVVFSYRFEPDPETYTVFSKDFGWLAFQNRAVELAKENKHVLVCDISDFYPRVYHHRLENALKKATKDTQAIYEIRSILSSLSLGVSYGLPVGGPAARLLSELLLNRVDQLLATRRIPYCRFVDDYYIFSDSTEQAYSHLIYLSNVLLENEGLTLQKTKTRILSSAEFLETSLFSDENAPEDAAELTKRDFLKLHIHYDPYSDTPANDYDALKEELAKFDVVGMLATEMRKTRISESLSRKLMRAIAYLSVTSRDQAVLSILENVDVLYPIFPTVMMVLDGVINDISRAVRARVFATVRNLIQTHSYVCRVPVNLAFAIRILAHDNSEEADAVLVQVHTETSAAMIKRDIILILAMHNVDYWISDCLKRFTSYTLWERRALIVASYILEDEGKYWRDRIRATLSQFDRLILRWAGENKESGKPLELR